MFGFWSVRGCLLLEGRGLLFTEVFVSFSSPSQHKKYCHNHQIKHTYSVLKDALAHIVAKVEQKQSYGEKNNSLSGLAEGAQIMRHAKIKNGALYSTVQYKCCFSDEKQRLFCQFAALPK